MSQRSLLPECDPPLEDDVDRLKFEQFVQQDQYRYVALKRPGNIRLLHLLPHHDRNGPLACQLLEYPLLELTKLESIAGMHLYEALSYSWGDAARLRSKSIKSRGFP